MSYFVTCTHEQRILNGTSSDTSLCHWGYLEKKIFPDVPDLPDVARSGQIWPDLGRLGKNFFSKKKKIFPDLARSGRPRSGDLARSGSIRVKKKGFIFFYTKNYVKTKSYRCAYMGRPPLVVRQMRGMKRKAAKGAGLCCSTGLES